MNQDLVAPDGQHQEQGSPSRPLCKHCEQPIEGVLHAAGGYRGKMRCDPSDSGLSYGYNAELKGTACRTTCVGSAPDVGTTR